MKRNGYNIICSILHEDEQPTEQEIDPIEITDAVASKIVDVTKKNPRKRLGNWGIHNAAKALRHYIKKKKEERKKKKENKIKGD